MAVKLTICKETKLRITPFTCETIHYAPVVFNIIITFNTCVLLRATKVNKKRIPLHCTPWRNKPFNCEKNKSCALLKGGKLIDWAILLNKKFCIYVEQISTGIKCSNFCTLRPRPHVSFTVSKKYRSTSNVFKSFSFMPVHMKMPRGHFQQLPLWRVFSVTVWTANLQRKSCVFKRKWILVDGA